MERVLVRTVTDLTRAVAEALDFFNYDFSGKRVWVKPNLLAPHLPSASVTTDPELVRATVCQLKARGAKTVAVGDNPGGTFRGQLEEFIALTGVVAASEGCFVNVAQSSRLLKLNSKYAESVPVSSLLFETDVLLNLPVFKTHALTILTGALKNTFGIVVGGQKTVLHTRAPGPEEFSELVVDIYQAIPVPMLHIMDALRGMDGQMGPSGGRVLKIGKLLSAQNGVALDSVMALMAGVEPDAIPALRIAHKRGLCPTSRDELQIAGDFEVIPGFRLPTIRYLSTVAGIAGLAYPLLRRRPVLVRGLCSKCARCAENCPVQAIALKPYPQIDRKKCISCFCCAEICPVRALRVPSAAEGALRNILGR